MRYTFASFTGYAGFFHGLGLRTFEVDFTRCISNIVLIVGRNASGKSTLMNSLNLFPDPSLNFLPDMDAEKKLSLFDNGNTYNIQIQSPLDGKGNRKVTKAFIQKNGMELNPNGNVSSYKDIIFSEFDLDSNFISLSKLSSNDRGLGDKTPAERKKFVANIIENLEVYNNIYKTLNKKSLIFKSHINTLSTKIQSTGNIEVINSTLVNLKRQEDEINKAILDLNNRIVAIQAKNSINEQEAKEIQDANNSRGRLLDSITDLKTNIDLICNKNKIKISEVDKLLAESIELSEYYKEQYNSNKILWTEKSNRLSDIQNNINNFTAELEKYKENTKNSVNELLDKSNRILKEIKTELKELGIDYSDPNAILSKIQMVRIEFESFIKYIDYLYGFATPSMLEFICSENIELQIKNINDNFSKLEDTISQNKSKMFEINLLMKSLSTLENRPTKCKIDNCPFISQALEVKAVIKDRDLIKEFEDLEKQTNDLSNQLQKCNESISTINSYIPEKAKLDAVLQSLSKVFLFKSLVPSYLEDKNTVLEMIKNMNYFNEMRTLEKLNRIFELVTTLISETENNKYLQVEFKRYTDNVNMLNSTNNMIGKLKEEYSGLLNDISTYKSEYIKNEQLYNEITPKIEVYKNLIDLLNKKKDLEVQLDSVDKILKNYQDKADIAASMVIKIQEYNNSIEEYKQSLASIQREISELNGRFILLNSYYEEYNKYNDKYNLIETIKKYCSPTGGGIQTVFMQLYMSKTLELSNQLLGMLFQGEYKLLDFIINENEFRIPFMDSSGLPIEDVAFGSNAQVSMIGLVINLVLLYQASSHYNIARLDEIGSSCDSYNRSQYIQVLNAVINILHMDQLFVISHDIDLDNTMCDIIKLKGYEGFDNSSLQGNVIFDYDEIIKGGN